MTGPVGNGHGGFLVQDDPIRTSWGGKNVFDCIRNSSGTAWTERRLLDW